MSRSFGPWIKLSATFPGHPKVQQLTDRQKLQLLESWAWVAEQATDGVIPRHSLRGIGPGFTPKLAEKFVRIGLWDEHPEGWCVHDWTDYNPTREQLETRREVSRKTSTRYRKKPKGDVAGDTSPLAGARADTTRHEVSASSTPTLVASTPEPERGAQAPPPLSALDDGLVSIAELMRRSPPEFMRPLTGQSKDGGS